MNDGHNDANLTCRVVAPKCLQEWKRRGNVVDGLNEHDANCMIRACADDGTNLFFVCCLEKKMPGIKGQNAREDVNILVNDESLVVVPKGLAIYDGQFLDCQLADTDHKSLSLEVAHDKPKPDKTDHAQARLGALSPDKTELKNVNNNTT